MLNCQLLRVAAGLAVAALSANAAAQSRTDDNAITQAEDGFGFSIGRESLGIYSAGNVRGFSPTAAGNLRIDGLYFDFTSQFNGLPNALISSTSIKVGLSAQGYPFAAPSGIADQSLNRPGFKSGESVILNGDSFGGWGVEVDGSLPVANNLSIGYGFNGGHVEYPDGTKNSYNNSETLIGRWRPVAGVELVPFWTLYDDYNDESNPFIVPLGDNLPRLPDPRHYDGPSWSVFRLKNVNEGLLGSANLARNWLLRWGVFRSAAHTLTSFNNLLINELPDGSGERIDIADPPTTDVSLSGEVRLTHSIAEGPRLHVFYLSVRGRDARRQFGGSDTVDLGPGRVNEKNDVPEPDFQFGPISRSRVTQTTPGIAYDGRWKNVGELSFSVSRAAFEKRTDVPGEASAVSKSKPWLYNGTLAVQVSRSLTAYAGYAKGFEESGIAPPNAVNRNESLPVIVTEQKDAGVSLDVGHGIKAVAGVFDLTRPYFGFNSANLFTQVGTTQSKGAEFSISGPVTPRLNVVLGGVLLQPKVVRDADVVGDIGPKPVGLPAHIFNANVNWRTPWKGVELDAALSDRGRIPATTDNLVFVPDRPQLNVGSHYHFELAKRSATFRLQLQNVFDTIGYAVSAPGVYGRLAGRYALGYLTVDL